MSGRQIEAQEGRQSSQRYWPKWSRAASWAAVSRERARQKVLREETGKQIHTEKTPAIPGGDFQGMPGQRQVASII